MSVKVSFIDDSLGCLPGLLVPLAYLFVFSAVCGGITGYAPDKEWGSGRAPSEFSAHPTTTNFSTTTTRLWAGKPETTSSTWSGKPEHSPAALANSGRHAYRINSIKPADRCSGEVFSTEINSFAFRDQSVIIGTDGKEPSTVYRWVEGDRYGITHPYGSRGEYEFSDQGFTITEYTGGGALICRYVMELVS